MTAVLRTRQTCIVGGWTDPRGSRPFFDSLLLGIRDGKMLRYVGRTAAGFSDAELGRIWRRMRALRTSASPFARPPRIQEQTQWVEPELAVDVTFSGWTADGRLRNPIYLELREDLDARTLPSPLGLVLPVAADRPRRLTPAAIKKVLDQLDEIQSGSGSGVLLLPGGDRLEVTNLSKVFWPKGRLTKGDLMRHDVRVAPYILPVVEDRPLVMKRFPNGISAKPFYQHRAPDRVPPGVRVMTIEAEGERRPHVIGGSLITLVYTAQLAAISQDPWFSRVGTDDMIDHAAIDLDPPEGLPFSRVRDVAKWVRDELDALRAPGFPKTSGAGGLHIYVPMPPRTPFAAGLLFCQIVATRVAQAHPKVATVERSIKARGNRIYVDYLQNVRGKTLASAYSARASEFAGVSAPLTWDELDTDVTPRDFTIANFAERLAEVGDLWAGLRKARGVDLEAVLQHT